MESPAGNLPNLLTCDDVADLLRVDVRTVWAMIRNGEIKAFKVGREYRIQQADYYEFITRKTNQN